MYRLSEFARLIGISRSGLIEWIRMGRIRAVNIHGRWYIPESKYEKLVKELYVGVRRIVIYAKVSDYIQRNDIEKQAASFED